MSRTVRRRHGLGRHIRVLRRFSVEEREKTLRWLHSEKYEPMNTPSWFHRMMVTKPHRQEVRRLTHQVLLLVDLEEAPLFPEKRPHIYYW